MSESDDKIFEQDRYAGTCTGPVFETCGTEVVRHFPIIPGNNSPPERRVRCPACSSVVLVEKDIQ